MNEIRHQGKLLFSRTELACRGSGLLILAPEFADFLLELRLAMDMPMFVNSACRSKEHNRSVNGHPRSLHVCDFPHWPTQGCCAIDVSTHKYSPEENRWFERPDNYRARLRDIAWDLGWSVGHGATFLHLDRRTNYIPREFSQHRQIEFPY